MQIQKYNHNIYNLRYSPTIISGQIRTSWCKEKQCTTNLEIWAKVFGNKGAVTLWQHHDLLLNIFNFIFSLFKIYYFNCHHLLCSIVDTLEYFPKWSFANPFLFREDQFRVHLLEQTQRQRYSTICLSTVHSGESYKHYHSFYTTWKFSTCKQQPTAGPYPKWVESSPCSNNLGYCVWINNQQCHCYTFSLYTYV